MSSLNVAFDAMNPSDEWINDICECPSCKEKLDISVPKEVRMSEWFCKYCKKELWLKVNEGQIKLEEKE